MRGWTVTFFASVIKYREGGLFCQEVRWESFPIRRSTACAPRSTAPYSSAARVCMQSMRIPLHQMVWNDIIRKIEEYILECGGINSWQNRIMDILYRITFKLSKSPAANYTVKDMSVPVACPPPKKNSVWTAGYTVCVKKSAHFLSSPHVLKSILQVLVD